MKDHSEMNTHILVVFKQTAVTKPTLFKQSYFFVLNPTVLVMGSDIVHWLCVLLVEALYAFFVILVVTLRLKKRSKL